jgi:hypothetical protein
VVLFGLAQAGAAQTYPLIETVHEGECFRIQLEMTLSGEMRVRRDGKDVPLKVTAAAGHAFPERVLALGPTGLPIKSARFYESAKATVQVDSEKTERLLRPERRLLVAQRYKDQTIVYCPTGPLTRPELELTSEHFDTLALTGLLPGKAVAVGESWKLAPAVAQALCGFEGLTAQELTVKLEAVQNDVAVLSIQGTAGGIDMGALVKLTVRGTAQFDLKAKRLTALEWAQKDERDQGPASPASSMETTTKVTRAATEPVDALSDLALVPVPEGTEVPKALLQLFYRDPQGQFELVYARDWQMVGRAGEHQVLRLLDRGDFVAQVSIAPWPRAEPGKHVAAEEFQQATARTPGWEQQDVVQAGEVPSEKGLWVYRFTARGQIDGLKVIQSFFLVAGPQGEQLQLAFMMTPKQVEKLGTRDLELVGGITFPGSQGPQPPAKP